MKKGWAGIDPAKIIVGLPLFGYAFRCTNPRPAGFPANNTCLIAQPPQYPQIQFSQALQLFAKEDTHGMNIQYDKAKASAWFEYTNKTDGSRFQVWFDDHRSVAQKSAWVFGQGYHGLSFWTADALYSGDGTDSAAARAVWRAAVPPSASVLKTDDVPPTGKGLFLSATTAAAYASALQNYERAVERSASAPYNLSTNPAFIRSIAVQRLAAADGSLYTPALQKLLPALTRSGKRLYIGTTNPPGGSASYCEELLNASWRHTNVGLSVSVAKAFLASFPSFDFDAWYITPEQFLNHLGDGCIAGNRSRISGDALATAQGAYLKEWTESLYALKPLGFLWSPSVPEFSVVGDGAFDLARYRSDLKDSLKTVLAAAPLVTELTLQDSMGKASAVINATVTRKINASNAIVHCQIASAAASELGRGATLALSINAELMLRREVAGKTFDLPADPREVDAREVAYRASGCQLGPSWEMSFWFRQQTEEWSLPDIVM